MAASGPCGVFRFAEFPDIKIGLVHLERKRPWPSCVNPETGNQWSEDMKHKIVQVLDKVPFQVFRADLNHKVDDDPTLRLALGELYPNETSIHR